MTTVDFEIREVGENMASLHLKADETPPTVAKYVPECWEELVDDDDVAAGVAAGALESLSTKSIYVGTLRDKWKFCSDHLPVGTRIVDPSGSSFNICSWNVLNSAYINWVENDSQGLAGAPLLKDHYKPSSNSGLTLREKQTVDMIVKMINDPTSPSDVLLLQECGWQFTIELNALLASSGSSFRLVKHTGHKYIEDQNLILFDTRKFDFLNHELSLYEFPQSAPGKARAFFEVLLRHKESNKFYRICNVHLPGDPKLNAPEEFALALKKREGLEEILVAGGDMNFDNARMRQGFDKVFSHDKSLQYVQAASQYNTNITPKTWEEGPLTTKSIDHIYVRDGDAKIETKPLRYDEVLKDESFFETLVALHTPA